MYHFPSKEELGAAMVAECREAWNRNLATLEGERESWPERWAAILRQITSPAEGFMAGSAVLGICAGEFPSLPVQMQTEVRLFHMNLNGWFVRFLSQAKRRGEIPQETEIDALAAGLLAVWQGGVLLHRTDAQDMRSLTERQVALWLGRDGNAEI
jgi:AcrR family transcriptional regulator